MISRNYTRPTVEPLWGFYRETHPAVAMAIHAISDNRRSTHDIWEDPTLAEWDHVTMAVEEYVAHGDFPAEPDGDYRWGEDAIILLVETEA